MAELFHLQMVSANILFQNEKSQTTWNLNLLEWLRPFSCAPNLVRISELFNGILEKQPKKTW